MTRSRFGRRAMACTLALSVALGLGGCVAHILPKKHELAITSFKTFGQTRDGYEKVVVNQTTIADLKSLGFDPDKSANIQQITYLDVVQAFLPRQDMPFSTVPTSVQTCVAAQNRCIGYAVAPKVSDSTRTGSIFLDFFNFRRRTEVNGWQAAGMFVLLDGVVVYKLWSGEPNIHTSSTQINPLGPVQDLGAAAGKMVPSPNF